MEAFMYRCEHPGTLRMLELLPEIGSLRLARLSIGYNMGPQYDNIRLSNPAAGGALMDIGCYPVSLARLVAGQEPIEMAAVGHIGRTSRVDEWIAGSLRFPSGMVTSFVAATQVQTVRTSAFHGSKGHILVDDVYRPKSEGYTIKITIGNETRVETVDAGKSPAQIEVEHVVRHLERRQSPGMDWADTLENQRVLDGLRKEIGLVFDCEK